jgi:hypothetical protein
VNVRIVKFYADIPAGTTGTIVKEWNDTKGSKWYKVFLGVNLSGKKLYKHFPHSVINTLCQQEVQTEDRAANPNG